MLANEKKCHLLSPFMQIPTTKTRPVRTLAELTIAINLLQKKIKINKYYCFHKVRLTWSTYSKGVFPLALLDSALFGYHRVVFPYKRLLSQCGRGHSTAAQNFLKVFLCDTNTNNGGEVVLTAQSLAF